MGGSAMLPDWYWLGPYDVHGPWEEAPDWGVDPETVATLRQLRHEWGQRW